MTRPEALSPIETVGRSVMDLAGFGVSDTVVTGSTALGVWATPRQSRDLDLCAAVPPAAVLRILAQFDGPAAGPPEAPGILRLRYRDWDVDVFVTTDDPYDRACASRAVGIATTAGTVRVVTAEDLLIHKFIKLHTDRRRLLQDLADMKALLDARKDSLDWTYLGIWLPKKEATLLETMSAMDDRQIVRAMLGPT